MMSQQKWQKKGKPKQGFFVPTNPKKVVLVENAQNNGMIVYRSSWERQFMVWLDVTPSVKRWASEPFPIPYIKPTDFREHKYYIDFYFEAVGKDGNIVKYMIEIKPKHETEPPKQPKKKTEKSMMNYQKRIETYQINQAKWESARAFAKANKLQFMIITEEELGIN